jgi:hypothetical protein
MVWMCKIWWTYEHKASYKILQLEVQKKALILHNLPCFQEGLFWGSFGLNAAIDVKGLRFFEGIAVYLEGSLV